MSDDAPIITPEEMGLLREQLDLKPGTEIEFRFEYEDGGTLEEQGHGIGAGAYAEGSELSDSFDGSAPAVNLTGSTASGGSSSRAFEGDATFIPAMPWGSPLFWVGLVCLGVAGFGVYAKLMRLAVGAGVAGVGLLAAAFYPVILIFALAGVAVVFLLPYIRAELAERRNAAAADGVQRAMGRVLAAVEESPDGQDIKTRVSEKADESDRDTIDAVKRANGIGKYQRRT